MDFEQLTTHCLYLVLLNDTLKLCNSTTKCYNIYYLVKLVYVFTVNTVLLLLI